MHPFYCAGSLLLIHYCQLTALAYLSRKNTHCQRNAVKTLFYGGSTSVPCRSLLAAFRARLRAPEESFAVYLRVANAMTSPTGCFSRGGPAIVEGPARDRKREGAPCEEEHGTICVLFFIYLVFQCLHVMI